MIYIDQYEKYFEEQIVNKYEKLNSFYRIDMFEWDSFLNDLRHGKIKTPALILESYEEKSSATNNYNVNQHLTGALIILDKFDVHRKRKITKTLFLKNVQHIIKQVQTKMINDSTNNCEIMHGLNLSSFSIAKTDLIASSYEGYRMEFSISNPDGTGLDNFWNS